MAPCGSEALLQWAGLDATEAFTGASHSASTMNLLESFCVGVLEIPHDSDTDSNKDRTDKSEFNFSWSCTSALERWSFASALHDISTTWFCSITNRTEKLNQWNWIWMSESSQMMSSDERFQDDCLKSNNISLMCNILILTGDSLRDLIFNLCVLMGTNCRKLVSSLPAQPAEIDCGKWMDASFLKKGLQVTVN